MTAAAMGVPAEVLAERLLRKAWDGAYMPDLNAIADECALTRREVEDIRDRLLNARKPAYTDPGRVQTLTRPSATHAPPSPLAATVAPPAGAGEPSAWRAAADHPNAKVRRAVAKAAAAVGAVEQLLAAEAGKDVLRRKEAMLAAQLAAVRAELRGVAPAGKASSDRVPCPDCGDMVREDRLKQHANRSAKHQPVTS